MFGDTSFLSTVGPSTAKPDLESPEIVPSSYRSDLRTDAPESPQNNELQHSDSVSSLTLDLDLDLDLGPSMLGDVLGVMDGLGLNSNEAVREKNQGRGAMVMSVNKPKELNGKNLAEQEGNQVEDSRIPDVNGMKPKGLRPKVRFSDKREEIIRQASEEEDSQTFGFQEEDRDPEACSSPVRSESETGKRPSNEVETELTNHKADLPPSPASSHSSEYEGVTPLDRRRVGSYHSETDSEEEEEEAEEEDRGYTFEDEFDDEIGL